MISTGNRRDGQPILIDDKSATTLKRVPFNDKQIQEGFLQGLIEDHPNLLPISEIEPAFAPALTVGFEVETRSGYIDNLLSGFQAFTQK